MLKPVPRSLLLVGFSLLAWTLAAQVRPPSPPGDWDPKIAIPGSRRGIQTEVQAFGKVFFELGGSPTEPVRIMINCMGRVDSAAVTDAKGGFRFRLSPTQISRTCTVYGLLEDFESSTVSMPSINPGQTTVNIGKIVLSGGGPGVVSVTSAGATKSARKNLERARKLIARREPDREGARKALQAAVSEYDLYAEAWLELGNVLAELERPEEALEAYGKAIEADPGFFPSYRPAIKFAHQQEATDLVHSWCNEGVRVDPTLRDACSLE